MRQILLIIIGLNSLVYADFSRSKAGVVTDSVTNLEWQDDYSDIPYAVKDTTWTDAIGYCEALRLDGKDWRLPNKKELLSIVDYSTYYPSISSVFQATIPSRYWSSTTYVDPDIYAPFTWAWFVSFSDGKTTIFHKDYSYYVRCVRGGQ